MYSESDLESAVDAGVLSRTAADAFRDHVAWSRRTPAVDEEQFRLLTGFNDIFVAIAIVLLLVAVGQLGGRIASALGGALVAGTAWMLAEYFTAKRRMALPSILLLLAFVGGVAAALGILGSSLVEMPNSNPRWSVAPADQQARNQALALVMAGVAALSAGAAWLHWRRFHVPITVAAGAAAAVGVVIGLTLAIVPGAQAIVWAMVLAGGVAVFALAMRWDLSDRERRTRRSDVAFCSTSPPRR